MSSKPSVSNGTSVTKGINVTNATKNTSAAPKESFAARASSASAAWRDFEGVLKRISKYSSAYSDIELAMDQHSAMELETRTKDTRISNLESILEAQVQEFEKRYSKWNMEKSQLELRAVNVETEVTTRARRIIKEHEDAHARESEELRKELEAERKNVVALSEKLERATTKMKKGEMELSLCNVRLTEWEGHVSILKDMDVEAFDGRVKRLFTHCYKIVCNHFLPDLPAQLFEDYTQWESLTRSLAVRLRFPPTNSPAARYVRMAAALHVLASRLCQNIFKPCYIPESIVASEAIKSILAHQSVTNVGKEPLTRALLLSTYVPSDVDAAIERAVHATSEEVLTLLSPISTGDHTLRTDIEALFNEAVDVWKEAQHSNKLVEASISDDDFEDWPWDQLEEFTSTVAQSTVQPGPQKYDALNLFPRVFIPADNHIVHHGLVLWPAQNIVVVAEQEFRQCMAARAFKLGRNGSVSGRSRRLSILNDGKNGMRAEHGASF